MSYSEQYRAIIEDLICDTQDVSSQHEKGETVQWYTWSYIPGVHWLAWFHAGILAKQPWLYALGSAYALPFVLLLISRTPSWRILLFSWVLCLIHVQVRLRDISRSIGEAQPTSEESLMQALVQASVKHDGCLTVTQGVMETGASFHNIEGVLNEMVVSGYVYKRNNPETGVIEYVFQEVL